LEQTFFYDDSMRERSQIELLNKDKVLGYKKDQRIVHLLMMIEGQELLDVGCGYGEIARIMAEKGHTVFGIDRVESFATIANEFNRINNAKFEVMDFLKNSFPDNRFDCITFLETIEHVENPSSYLREFLRILKPGGHLVLSTPNATSLKNIVYALGYRKKSKREKILKSISNEPVMTGTQLEHIFNWDFPTLTRLLHKCGFEIVDHALVSSGPIIIPFLGKRIKIIKKESNLLNNFESLKTTQIIKCRKPSSNVNSSG
jgi:2-polyprenyl-3-methyl-5-hydroxy-6-metoxy-1,4-benzoquinol methylase